MQTMQIMNITEQRDKAVMIGIDAYAKIEALQNVIRDGVQQFSRLTGPNLEQYARTWAVLAAQYLPGFNTATPVGRDKTVTPVGGQL